MINRMSINRPERKRGFLTVELVVAMAILLVAVFPLSYGFLRERQVSRACYYRAVAMEIVDGEMEVLQCGEWRAFGEGSQAYSVRAESAANTGKLLQQILSDI